MTAIVFLLILSFLVIIHELGHFLVARKNGIKVEEFGIGYPPRALRFFKDKHGTEYTLNWLPFGGFVRLFGEDGEASIIKTKKSERDELFFTKKKRVRLAVILAGVVINFLFGVLAFGLIYTLKGIPVELDHPQIQEVAAESPAAQAGLQAGDLVLSVKDPDAAGAGEVIDSTQDLITTLQPFRGEEVVLEVRRNEEVISVPIYVRTEAEVPQGQGTLGVVLSDVIVREDYPLWQRPFIGMWVGLKSAIAFGWLILVSLGDMVKDLLTTGAVPKEVAGPVGIVYMAQREGLLTGGLISILNFAAILSINLAIINLLPFPALDGGRAFFIALEGFIGRRIQPKLEQWANMVGMLFLLMLIVLITLKDVSTVLRDQQVQQWWEGVQQDLF